MRATFKTGLLVGASIIALGMIGATPPARAFDTVNWRWDADVDETVNKFVNININIDPTGLVMVEDLQVFVGNAKATSTVYDIKNEVPEKYFNIGHDPVIDALKQLPSVVSAATAVANNTSITADTAVQLHEGQFAFGGAKALTVGGNEDNKWYSGNSNLSLANILLGALGDGGLTKSKIEATSNVYEIKNATVDSSATAVANNLNVSVAATGPNRLLMGDVTQFAVADVTATSKVHDIEIENYINLASSTLGRPIVSSVATAVGNNKSITVTAPVIK